MRYGCRGQSTHEADLGEGRGERDTSAERHGYAPTSAGHRPIHRRSPCYLELPCQSVCTLQHIRLCCPHAAQQSDVWKEGGRLRDSSSQAPHLGMQLI